MIILSHLVIGANEDESKSLFTWFASMCGVTKVQGCQLTPQLFGKKNYALKILEQNKTHIYYLIKLRITLCCVVCYCEHLDASFSCDPYVTWLSPETHRLVFFFKQKIGHLKFFFPLSLLSRQYWLMFCASRLIAHPLIPTNILSPTAHLDWWYPLCQLQACRLPSSNHSYFLVWNWSPKLKSKFNSNPNFKVKSKFWLLIMFFYK